jgi:hypothetical protein
MSDLTLTSADDGVNSDAGIYPGMVPTADQWNLLFTGKVDANNGFLTNPTVFGYLSLTETPSQDVHAASKSYVDGKISGSSIPDAAADGTPYCRQNNTWVPAPTQLAASVAGNLTIPGALTVGQGANVTGDSTITGRLTVHGALVVDTTLTVGGAATFTGGILGTPIGQGGLTSPASFSSVIVAPADIYGAIPGLPVGYTSGLRAAADPATASNVFLDAWSAITGYNGRRASGTPSSPTGVAGNAVITGLNAFGHDGGAYTTVPQAAYQIKTLNSWSTGDHSTQHQWFGTASGAITQAAWLTLVNGNLLLGGVTDAGYRLDVTGAGRISAGLGVWGRTPPAAQPSFTGAKGGNTALASVIAALVAAGIGIDTTTA